MPEGEDEEEETVVQGDMHHACYVNAVLDLFFEKVDWRRIATTPIGIPFNGLVRLARDLVEKFKHHFFAL